MLLLFLASLGSWVAALVVRWKRLRKLQAWEQEILLRFPEKWLMVWGGTSGLVMVLSGAATAVLYVTGR